MGKWLSLYPSELELGDVLGEQGPLVGKHPHQESRTWTLCFSVAVPAKMRPPTTIYTPCTVYEYWPEEAPLRVFRPDTGEL